MAVGDNPCIPYYEPGARITAHCEAAVTGKRFVAPSDPIQSGPELNTSVDGSNIVVSHAGAGARALGVAAYDQAIGGKVPVLCGPGMVVPVTAEAGITAGAQVQVGVNGQAVTWGATIATQPVGLCLDTVLTGEDAPIRLY